MQIIQAIPRSWETNINDPNKNGNNFVISDQYLIISQQIYQINRKNS